MNIEKLPRWAQEHIRDLQKQRNDAVEKLNRFTDTQTESTTFYDEYVFTGKTEIKRIWIPSDRICFKLANRSEIEVSSDGGSLRISSHTGAVLIKPTASNTIHVKDEER